MRQRRGGDNRGIGDAHAMVQFVFFLETAQDRDGVGDRRLGDEHRLEAAGQRGILFDMLAIFVERGRADAMEVAPRESRFQKVRCVHRAVRLAGANERVHFVDEEDNAAGGGGDFVQDRFQPLLELAAIFRSRDERTHVERKKLLVAQAFRHIAIDDAQRKALDNRGFADTRLADQNRIIFRAPRQYLNGSPDFFVAADHRIEFSRARGIG